MDSESRYTPSTSVERARGLRMESTKAERLLWSRLRAKRTGFKFRRQHPIGEYILDFFCFSAGVAIELDGLSHEERFDRDEARSAFLAAQGILVLRYQNLEVLADADGIAAQIEFTCRERASED